MNRDRFPGLSDGWARLDGAAGSQVLDSVIEAMSDFMRSGSMANHGGAFKQAIATDELVASTRAACATLLGGDPEGIFFGPSFTATTMRFSATVVRDLEPGDEIVCTRLDHDSNVRPWVIAAERAGVTVRFAEPVEGTLELAGGRRRGRALERTKWVAVTAASTRSAPCRTSRGSSPPRTPSARRSTSTRSTPRRTAATTWPRSAPTCSPAPPTRVRPARLGAVRQPRAAVGLSPGQAQPGAGRGSDRWELGTLPFESLAGVRAAAEYMLELDFDAVRAHEEGLMAQALDGLRAMDHVTLYGDAADRAPTLMFTVAGHHPDVVAKALAEREISVWNGNYYAWELERVLGLAPHGGIRAGFLHYNDASDTERLLAAVAELGDRG